MLKCVVKRFKPINVKVVDQSFFSARSQALRHLTYINFREPKRKVPVRRNCIEKGTTLLT